MRSRLSLHKHSVVLHIGWALKKLPVQLSKSQLLLEHCLRVILEEASWNDLERRYDLLAGPRRNSELGHLSIHPIVSHLENPGNYLQVAVASTQSDILVSAADDVRLPEVVVVDVDDLTWLQSHPIVLEGRNWDVATMSFLFIPDRLPDSLIDESQKNINVVRRQTSVLGGVAGRLVESVLSKSVEVVHNNAVRSINSHRVS